MLALLPFALQILILGAIGLTAGVLINWAIYAWAYFLIRPISPWMKPAEEESARQRQDYFPIIGWPGRARDKKVYGRGFWVRPMLIEIVWMIGLPWFYFWLAGGGLVGQAVVPSWWQAETWFWLYSIFLGLMTIGTFIDFDEKMIPDAVTIPGTIVALIVAAIAPWSRLPEFLAGGLAGPALRSVPHDYPIQGVPADPTWQQLLVVLAILVVWIWALLPKFSVWYCGWGTTIKFMYAHAFRPKRKTTCELRTKDRSLPGVTLFLCVMLLVGVVATLLAWSFLPAINWHSLYGAFIGLAFGGAMIWSIRIVGTYAMQQEAMGFGDVTLMAMIGAMLGWQATLIAFAFAMMVVLLGVVVQLIFIRDQQLPFGPYLCAGAAIAIYQWHVTWPGAARGVFQFGNFIWWILAASLVLMALMLIGIQWVKRLFGLTGEVEAE